MTLLKLKYVDCFVDRHGRSRHYFRRGHGPRIALPGLPGSAEFMDAYQAALKSVSRQHKLRRKERGASGTFDRLVQTYFSSSEYLRLALSTQVAYRRVIKRFVLDENIGHRLVREMKREHVKRMIAKRAATPGAANDLLKKIRILVQFAIDSGWRSDDPTLRLKKFAGSEFHTWSNEEIAQFERRWPIGSCERTAFALLLFTGQRRSDVVRMAWSDIAAGAIRLTQRKTGAKLSVPIHSDLAEALAAWSNTHDIILTTAFGKPFSANGFGNYMADKIALAGLPDRCVTHGLRKAAARRLAEAGCSANEIASITGHTTLIEVSRYTKAAEQSKLAQTAIGRLQGRPQLLLFPNLPEWVGRKDKNISKINSEFEDWRTRQESNL
jgi:integrase